MLNKNLTDAERLDLVEGKVELCEKQIEGAEMIQKIKIWWLRQCLISKEYDLITNIVEYDIYEKDIKIIRNKLKGQK